MAGPETEKPKVVAFKDHQVITPDTRKFRRIMREALPGEPDPVEAAERALARLAGDFPQWMKDECAHLDAARQNVKNNELSKESSQELFLAAHNIKGDAGTFGFPEVVRAADSLCRLIEYSPELKKIPLAIIDQHVDAIRAIVREHNRGDIAKIAGALVETLRSVTDEFLVAENQHRPEVLRALNER
jgi:chemotaxis protein histidine kinase CheA